MTSRYQISFVLCLLLGTIGCAARRAKSDLPSFVIEPSCVTKPIILTGCDLKTEPPHCLGSKITYTKGCGKIEVKK